jgi:DNA-binding response OmpR family regulator
MDKKRILVVDDEENIVELLKMDLKRFGYEVICAYHGEEAIEKALAQRPDLILLDIMMPGIDGLEVCRRIKMTPEIAQIPIIMLSARSEEADKVIGLGIGADDYITKPFGFRELHARINVALRRVEGMAAQVEPRSSLIRIGALTVDPDRNEVRQDGQLIDLTLSEFTILRILADRPGITVTRQQLMEAIGSDKNEARSLDVHMANLRRKLGKPKCIATVRGVGYKMAVDHE